MSPELKSLEQLSVEQSLSALYIARQLRVNKFTNEPHTEFNIG